MMKNLLIAACVLLVLGGCVSHRYHSVFGGGGGHYYIAESPPSVSYYHSPYWSLYGYGISPWWGYSYYSPYFYPHDFHVWYAPWPYRAPWPYYSSWYARNLYGPPPHRRHAPLPGHGPVYDGTGAALPGYSGTPIGAPAPGAGGRWGPADGYRAAGELRYGGPGAELPVNRGAARSSPRQASPRLPTLVGRSGRNPDFAAPRGSIGTPPAVVNRPVIGGRANPARVRQPGPTPHKQ